MESQHLETHDLISELRDLIVEAAPDPALAEPVRECGPDDLLDEAIPFSSVIVLGTIVAVEERFGVRVTRKVLVDALDGGVTLGKLARMVEKLQDVPDPVRQVG